MDKGAPTHWTYAPSIITTAASATSNAVLTTVALERDCFYFAPPVEASYTLVLYVDTYSDDLLEDTDTSYWTILHPDILVRATLYQLELVSRNTEAAKHWLSSILPDLKAINDNSTDIAIHEEFEMEMNG